MKRVSDGISINQPITVALTAIIISGILIVVPVNNSYAAGIKVMSPEETGDAALVTRVKAQKRSEKGIPGQGGDSDSNSSSDGCSDINIGTVQAKPGQMVPRKVVNIIEGPIIQQNKCK